MARALIERGEPMSPRQHRHRLVAAERARCRAVELETVSYDDESLIMNEYMKKIGAELIIPLVYKGDIKGISCSDRKAAEALCPERYRSP
jgi:hypothetical protein